MTRKMRLTQALVERIAKDVPDPGPMAAETAFDREGYCRAALQTLLAERPEASCLWVFAIGSLIWKPRFSHDESRPARVHGWHRAFCIGPDMRYRGNPDHPGLMLSLTSGGSCRGVVLRIPEAGLEQELDGLLRAEPPILPRWVTAHTESGPVRAIAFACPRDWPRQERGLTEPQIADRLSRAVGKFGSMADYLFNTVRNLEAVGIHDPYLWRMQDLVAARLEKIAPASR